MTIALLHPSFSHLKAQADGTAVGRRQADHFARCATCRKQVMELRELQLALHHASVPPPDAGLLERILTARASGTRIILPSETSSSARVRLPFVTAVAAVALLAVALGIVRSMFRTDEAGVSHNVTSLFRTPSVALAQHLRETPARPTYDLMTRIDASRLKPGRWTYDAAVIIDNTLRNSPSVRTFALAAGEHQGRRAWQISNEWSFGPPARGRFVDTMVADQVNLAPLGRSVTRSLVTQEEVFFGDSVSGIHHILGTNRYPAKTVRGTARLPHPVVDWLTLKAVLQAAPLQSSWRASLYVVSMEPYRDTVYFPTFTLDMRVAGRERITVPAGIFDCWKVILSVAGEEGSPLPSSARGSEIWVSRDRQWVIEVRDRFADDMMFQEQLIEGANLPAP